MTVMRSNFLFHVYGQQISYISFHLFFWKQNDENKYSKSKLDQATGQKYCKKAVFQTACSKTQWISLAYTVYTLYVYMYNIYLFVMYIRYNMKDILHVVIVFYWCIWLIIDESPFWDEKESYYYWKYWSDLVL